MQSVSTGFNQVADFLNNMLPPGFQQRGVSNVPDPRFGPSGWNPMRGADQGPLPPGFSGRAASSLSHPSFAWAIPQQSFVAPAFQAPPAPTPPTFAFCMPPQATPTTAPALVPALYPVSLPYGIQPAANATEACKDMPGMNLRNPHGGTGSLPGYAYLFPPEHTLVHIIKTKDPPWQLASNIAITHHAAQVPTNISIADFLSGMGADNRDSKKNVVHEVVRDGKGGWRKGVRVDGSEKKTVGDMGWNMTRTGRVDKDETDVVWVWITKT